MFYGYLQDFDSEKYVKVLFEAVYPRLDAHDIDQEIKECAITAVGMIVRHLGEYRVLYHSRSPPPLWANPLMMFFPGDHLSSELPRILSVLMEKLRNEITRMPTLKALASIATSPLQINLGEAHRLLSRGG